MHKKNAPFPHDLTKRGYAKFPAIIIKDYLKQIYPRRKRLMGKWLCERMRGMIYAKRGTGKTHFVDWLAAHLALGRSFLRWKVRRPHRVCILDGEMHPSDLQTRFSRIAERFPALNANTNLLLIPSQLYDGKRPDLATEEGQRVVDTWLPADIDLLIIDTLSAWTSGGREDAVAWDGVERWMRQKSREGIAVLLVHHAGKSDRGPRGTSAMQDEMEVIIGLKRPRDYKHADGARFEVTFEKARELTGKSLTPFEVTLAKGEDGIQRWVRTEIATQGDLLKEMKKMHAAGKSMREIAKHLSLNPSTVSRQLRQLREG